MPCLILDTSTELCLLALFEESRIIGQEIFAHHNLLSKNLLPSIQELLQKHGLSPSQLTAIALGIGPGSYTGTRLGVSVGKSLAFGLNLPLKTFSSPLAFLPSCEGAFACILPTRSGSFFVLKGSSSKSAIYHETPLLTSSEKLVSAVENIDFFVSPSIELKLSEIIKRPVFPFIPNLQTLLLFLAHTTPTPPENVELLYLHHPDREGAFAK